MAVDEKLAAEALSASGRISAALETVEDARRDFQRAVRALYVEGASMREIADRLGISHQRVHQLLDLPKPDKGRRAGRRGKRALLACSFCDRDQADVRKLIAGENVFVCDGCVALARTVLTAVGAGGAGAVLENGHTRLWRSADTPKCSFCGKHNDVLHPKDGVPLVTGSGARGAICRECLDLCQEILDEELS